jgi:hypothetical protein
VPDWASATAYTSIDATLTAVEQFVLDEPNRQRPGSPFYSEAYEPYFCHFRLPEVVRGYTIRDRNVIVDSDGVEIEIQVFRQKFGDYEAPDPAESGVDDRGSRLTDEWVLISGARVTDDGRVILPSPAIDVYEHRTDINGKSVTIYKRVHLYATLTILSKGGTRLNYSTGTRGNWSSLAPTFRFVNDSLSWSVAAATVDGHDFPCVYRDPDLWTWETLTAGAMQSVNNDAEYLARLCENVLAERMHPRNECSLMLMAFTPGFRIGDGVHIRNANMRSDRLFHITRNDRDLITASTTLRVSDAVPAFLDAPTATPRTQPLPKPTQEGASSRGRDPYAPLSEGRTLPGKRYRPGADSQNAPTATGGDGVRPGLAPMMGASNDELSAAQAGGWLSPEDRASLDAARGGMGAEPTLFPAEPMDPKQGVSKNNKWVLDR